MKISNISLPEVYRESQDFRFFCCWFENALQEVKYDIENLFDCYDPLRCKSELLWMLADTMGYVYDDRLPTSFNRLVLIYFMSMIYNRGSQNGMILAAETNLAQFRIKLEAEGYTETVDGETVVHPPKEILYDRLEDTSIPVNSVSVIPHPDLGYIDVVYFSEQKPIDACIEYVRPVGMFIASNVGVKLDSNTKICIDARLTDYRDMKMSIGPTFVGHYSRDDYARLQKKIESTGEINDPRQNVWYRNSVFEGVTNPNIKAGLRSLFSLQTSNNEHTVMSLLPTIFSLGYGPQNVDVTYPDDYRQRSDSPEWNLRYDYTSDMENIGDIASDSYPAISTLNPAGTSTDILHPDPQINQIMARLGDPIANLPDYPPNE